MRRVPAPVMVAVASLLLAGCSDGHQTDACAKVRKTVRNQIQALKITTRSLNAAVSQTSGFPSGSPSGYATAPWGHTSDKYARLSNLKLSETRVLAHLIVNGRTCFPPQTVAQAQDLLDSMR